MAASVTQIKTAIRKVLSVISEHNPNTTIEHLMNFSIEGLLAFWQYATMQVLVPFPRK
jgi:hypothetical protein